MLPNSHEIATLPCVKRKKLVKRTKSKQPKEKHCIPKDAWLPRKRLRIKISEAAYFHDVVTWKPLKRLRVKTSQADA